MSAPRKFATLTADALRRSVTPEMERAAELQVREIVRRVWWVLQPYRSFGESRVTIRRTEDTMKYIRGLPADSTQRATATATRVQNAAQSAWRNAGTDRQLLYVSACFSHVARPPMVNR